MTKRVVLNETIISKMKSVLGEDISPDNYVVYKARAISTEAISKRGSDLLNGATPTENFIRSIVAMANEPQKNVSVHTMNPELRVKMMKNKKDASRSKNMKRNNNLKSNFKYIESNMTMT